VYVTIYRAIKSLQQWKRKNFENPPHNLARHGFPGLLFLGFFLKNIEAFSQSFLLFLYKKRFLSILI